MEIYFTYWTWGIAALVLAGLEIILPGTFMIWLAGAAATTALVTLAAGVGWQVQLVVFALVAVASIVAGRAFLKRHPLETTDSGLNRRGARLIGRSFVLTEPIVRGEGRVQVDDSPWLVLGPDMPAGTRIKVVRLDGAALVVEPEVARPEVAGSAG